MLALSWPYVGPTLAYVGPMLAHLGDYVEAMSTICETLLKDLQDANFSFPDPSAEPKTTKKPRFFTFANKKKGSAEATKHRRKQCFCDLTHTKHRKLRRLQSTRGEPGVGRQQGAQRL